MLTHNIFIFFPMAFVAEQQHCILIIYSKDFPLWMEKFWIEKNIMQISIFFSVVVKKYLFRYNLYLLQVFYPLSKFTTLKYWLHQNISYFSTCMNWHQQKNRKYAKIKYYLWNILLYTYFPSNKYSSNIF